MLGLERNPVALPIEAAALAEDRTGEKITGV
jgi:hypothetical protein